MHLNRPSSQPACVQMQPRNRGRFSSLTDSSRVSELMTVYVAEIKGRGVAAFRADNGPEAERLVHDRVFRDDLMALASGGLPLWDGVADIQIRRARPDEEARWRASHNNAIRRGDIEAGEQAWIAFLVTLTNPDRRKHDGVRDSNEGSGMFPSTLGS